MANVRVQGYVRGKQKIKGYVRKARPHYGKKITFSTEKFVVRRDEFGQIRGYAPLNEVRKKRRIVKRVKRK